VEDGLNRFHELNDPELAPAVDVEEFQDWKNIVHGSSGWERPRPSALFCSAVH
jgi:hypothetical protein